MKTFLLLSILATSLLSSCKGKKYNDSIKITSKDTGYLVYKIDSINNYNLIYVEKDSIRYKIIAKKNHSTNCRAIEVGQFYNFNLTSLLFDEGPNGEPAMYSLHIGARQLDDSTTIYREDSVADLSFEKNIVGLCFDEAKQN